MENMSTQELETLLNERLEAVKLEKTGLKETIDSIDTKIRNQITAIKEAPKETEQEITVAMQKLERTHSTTSQTTVQERQFMRDMDKLRQKKKALALYMKVQADIDVLKSNKNVQMKELHDRETLINELFGGLRKVKLAQKLSCNLTDLFEQTINIEESKISRVVGKGGQNLRTIEGECGVSLDMDRVGGGIHIMGTRATIELALDMVMSIVDTAIEEFTAPEVIVICLQMEKQLLLNEIQARHNVRVDIVKNKNHVKVTGLVDAVTAAKAEILAVQGQRQTLQLEAAYLPFIIGKAGSTITGIEDDNKVSVNLNREKNELEVLGLKANVAKAIAQIKAMIDTNKEIEEVIRVEKHVLLGCLIGSGGSIIKAINKEFGVRVESEGAKDDQFQAIKIKGSAGRVVPAKHHIMGLVQTFIANTLVFEVADEFMAVLLGKGGASIRTLRDKYPGANIDIDKNVIHIQSANPVLRANIKAEIDAVIETNYTESMEMSEDCIIQLKSQRGYDLREELLSKTFNLKLIMDKSNNFVKLRGLKLNVLRGMQRLQAFKNNFTTVKISIHEEDYPIFFKNSGNSSAPHASVKDKDTTATSTSSTTPAAPATASSENNNDSLVRSLEVKYDIEILAIRKELSFVIRGSPQGVAGAKAHVEGFLAGNPAFGAVLITLETLVYSALIGKNGANIKKMEEEFGVKFDILKSRNLLRIRGEPSKIIPAKHAVLTFIDNTRVTDHLTFPASLQKKQLDAILKAASEIYQLELQVAGEDSHRLVLKGVYSLTEEAKVYLKDHFQGTCVGSIRLLPKHVLAIGNKVSDNFKRLHDKYGVTFELNTTTNSLDIRGATPSVYSAKADAMKFLETFFTAEVHVLEVASPSAFRDVLSYNLLSEVQEGGAQIFAHRAINRFFVLSETPSGLALAKAILQNKLSQWSELNESVDFEEFMYPMIIGKAGAAISALCKETHVSIEINRVTLKLEIKGATKQIVQDAKETIAKRVEKLRSEHWEVPVSGDMIGLIIGKQGATINKIRAETGANVDFDAKVGVLRVSGGEDKVGEARLMIEEIIALEEKNKAATRYVSIPAAAIPCVIGTKGATSKEIQNVSGARLDVDRVNLRCVLKGSEEACAKAAEMIEDLLDKEGYSKPVVVAVVAPVVAAPAPVEETRPEPIVVAGGKKALPGANPEQLTRQQLAGMSKSALKRYRKKLAGGSSADDEDEEVAQVVAHVNTPSVPPPLEPVEEEEEPVAEVAAPAAPSPVVAPVFISAIPAPVLHAPVPVAAISLAIPSTQSLPVHQVGVPSSPVRLGAPVAVSVPFNINGLLGKSSASGNVGVIGRNSSNSASPPAVSAYSSFDKQISSFENLQIGSNSSNNAVEAPIFVSAAPAPVPMSTNLFLQQPAPVFSANGTAVNAPTPVRSELFSRLLGPTTPQALPVYKAPQVQQQQQQQQQMAPGFAQQSQPPAWGSNSSFTGPSFLQQQQQLHQQQMQLQQQQQQLYLQQQQFAQAQQQFAQQQQMPQPPQQNYNGMMTLNNQQQQQQFPPLGMRQQQQAYQQQSGPPGIQQQNGQHAPPGLMFSQQQQGQQQQGGPNVGSAIGNGAGQVSPEFLSSLTQPQF